MSSKTATTRIFQSGVRNWPASMSRHEIEVFNPQAWDSHLRRESWQVYLLFFVCLIHVRLQFGNFSFWGESTWRKTSRSKGENQQQTLPTYTYIGNIGVDVVMWTLATWWEALALTSEPPLLPLHNLYLQAIIACDYSVSVTIYIFWL